MRSLRHYLACLIQSSGRGVGLALVLMLLVTATEGVGLVLLVPLLALVGVEDQQGPLARIAEGVGSLLRALGLQPTLGMVLALFLAVVSLRALVGRWETQVSLTLEYEFAARLRERLYKAITGASWPFLSRRRSSDLVHVLTAEVDRAGAAAAGGPQESNSGRPHGVSTRPRSSTWRRSRPSRSAAGRAGRSPPSRLAVPASSASTAPRWRTRPMWSSGLT